MVQLLPYHFFWRENFTVPSGAKFSPVFPVKRKALLVFAFVTRRHIDIRTRSSKQPTNPPKCCTVTMVNRDYCSVKNCHFNSSSNKRTERVSFHKIPTQSHLKTIWKRFIRRGKPRNHTVGEIHFVNQQVSLRP